MSRPRIGLTCRCDPPEGEGAGEHQLPDTYVRAVLAAGGLPLIFPVLPAEHAAALLDAVDGLLLTGGVDVDPRHFGQLPDLRLGRVSPERDGLELALAREAMARGLPVLAICRGVQVLNVALGGTLVQDIPSAVRGAIKHQQQAPRWYATHPVTVTPGTRLAALLGEGVVDVNSFHHQACDAVAPGFVVAARAPDGVVEAIEPALPGPFVVGVQWHPEGMWARDPLQARLFTALVEAASGRGVVQPVSPAAAAEGRP